MVDPRGDDGRDPAREVATRLPVTDRRSWLLLAGVALLLIGGLAWAALGRAPETVSGRGLVAPAGGFVDVGTVTTGIVDAVLVVPGDSVRAGDPVARLHADGPVRTVKAPVDGTVMTVLARSGGTTEPGVPLVTLDPSGAGRVAVGFLPGGTGKRVRPGMAALVAPDSVPRSQYGMVTGTVVSVSPLPVTEGRAELLMAGNAALARYFLGGGPVLEVTVDLDVDPTTPSGLAWTLGSGPDAPVTVGTLADVVVVVDDGTPLDRILQ